jgi:hypothetical protein
MGVSFFRYSLPGNLLPGNNFTLCLKFIKIGDKIITSKNEISNNCRWSGDKDVAV